MSIDTCPQVGLSLSVSLHGFSLTAPVLGPLFPFIALVCYTIMLTLWVNKANKMFYAESSY